MITEQNPNAFEPHPLVERCLGNIDLAKSLVDMFVDSFPTEIDDMRQHAARQDALTLSSQAHRIKGAASNLSAGQIVQVAAIIESNVLDGQVDSVDGSIAQLETAMTGFLNTVAEFDWDTLQPEGPDVGNQAN